MIPVLQRIGTLLVSHGEEIVSREKGNQDVIHIYNVGGWWVAFECSAYLLSRLHMGCYPSVLRISEPAERPPLIMDGLSEDDVERLIRLNVTLHDETNYKAFASGRCNAALYAKWKNRYLAMSR